MERYFYDKFPATKVEEGFLLKGWDNILSEITPKDEKQIIAIDSYNGIHYEEMKSQISNISHSLLIDMRDLYKSEEEIRRVTDIFLSDDVLFGYQSNLSMRDFLDVDKVSKAQIEIKEALKEGNVIIFGSGSSKIAKFDRLIYADMPRWEILMRMRTNSVNGLGLNDKDEAYSFKYKRGYFVDWKVLDKHKKTLYQKVDYWLDSTKSDAPKLIDKRTFFEGIERTIKKPFRVMPFFDPAPWGGQWMKEVCGLDKSVVNYGWCFDCVPDENSLLFNVNDELFEMPSVNLVYIKNKDLLGDEVHSRFGDSFPIRFDLLDTMGGGNLSLQVHPTTQYTLENFGLPYTQDESYYLVEAEDDGVVYLGFKEGVDSEEMTAELKKAEENPDLGFDDEKYVNIYSAKKHDHFLIPSGTIHCSGTNTVVLEISSTPNLFTFKLWDWNRLDLEGKPRPINVDRGIDVLDWSRDTKFVEENLINQFEKLREGDGWMEEATGLYKTQFIETRRQVFSEPVSLETEDSVNVLCLVDGDEIVVESPTNAFEPFVVNYAETFIIPATLKEYTIRPHGRSEGKECITIKASVRF